MNNEQQQAVHTLKQLAEVCSRMLCGLHDTPQDSRQQQQINYHRLVCELFKDSFGVPHIRWVVDDHPVAVEELPWKLSVAEAQEPPTTTKH